MDDITRALGEHIIGALQSRARTIQEALDRDWPDEIDDIEQNLSNDMAELMENFDRVYAAELAVRLSRQLDTDEGREPGRGQPAGRDEPVQGAIAGGDRVVVPGLSQRELEHLAWHAPDEATMSRALRRMRDPKALTVVAQLHPLEPLRRQAGARRVNLGAASPVRAPEGFRER